MGGIKGTFRGTSCGDVGKSSSGSCLIMGIGKNGSGKMVGTLLVLLPPEAIVRLGALITIVEEDGVERRLFRLGVRTGVSVTFRFNPLARDSILLAMAGVMFFSLGNLVGVCCCC